MFLLPQTKGTVMVMIVWQLDLQLPMPSVPITTEVVSLNLAHGEVYLIQHYEILNLFFVNMNIAEILHWMFNNNQSIKNIY
jgi:hypothetical protein